MRRHLLEGVSVPVFYMGCVSHVIQTVVTSFRLGSLANLARSAFVSEQPWRTAEDLYGAAWRTILVLTT